MMKSFASAAWAASASIMVTFTGQSFQLDVRKPAAAYP
jgi:hypothetical protein